MLGDINMLLPEEYIALLHNLHPKNEMPYSPNPRNAPSIEGPLMNNQENREATSKEPPRSEEDLHHIVLVRNPKTAIVSTARRKRWW